MKNSILHKYSRQLLITLAVSACFYFLLSAHGYAASSAGFSKGGGELFNKVIRAVEVQGLTRIKKEEFLDLAGLGTGDILDRERLRIGIRRAFKKDIFTDIEVEARRLGDGVLLKYIVKEIPVIEKIVIKGNKKLSAGKIRDVLIFKEDEDFREELLGRARADLAGFYRRKGFPDAAVDIRAADAGKPSRVILYVNIEEGRPLVIREIDVPPEAEGRLRLSEGDILDMDVLDKDIGRLREYYKKQGYLRPVVGPYEFRDGVLKIPVDRGPGLELVFRGNSAVSAKKLKKEAPFMDNEEVSDELVEEAVGRIKRLYLSRGYYYATVAAGVEKTEEKITVTFFINEGKRVILRKITFQGNSIPGRALRGVVLLRENKPYNENLLSGSRQSLVNFYNALGYLKAGVTGIEKKFSEDGTELDLVFTIHEGSRTIIREVRIHGNSNINRFEIKKALRLREGSPYNVTDIRDARYRLLSLYSRYGYLDARVDVESTFDGDNAVLDFRITENLPTVIGKIIIRGNRKTKPGIIRREFTIKEGDPYNYEEIIKTRQRLYKLGLFNRVSIDMTDTAEETRGALVKDLVVSLKEGNPGSVEIGLGYGDYEKFRASLDIRYDNLGGYNRRIGFRAEASSVKKKYVLNFREPRLFNEPDIPFNLFLTKEETRAVNPDTDETRYRIDRLSLLAGIEKEFTSQLKGGLNYEYSFTDTTDVAPDVILSREDAGTIGIGSISPSLFYDTRDDPFDPTSGSLQGVILKFASGAFLSEVEFVKATLQSSWYFGLMKGLVFAVSFRGGAAYGFGGTQELPLIERFFLGGRTTVRGYSQDTLGPKGADGNPTGGNMFSLVNGEFRISIGKGFGIVTFVDSGNVWTLAEDTDTRMKYTVGAGLRYSTPVGPVRIDYGYKLNREEGESSGEIHFSLGQAF
ncbi:MAG: outer membrane protein assembly factor BamA [Deferribacteres bacterium]|nr:outer membrane protein assembly factor BamA [Deferribacteres bacterium]